jgi:hypothetical protein
MTEIIGRKKNEKTTKVQAIRTNRSFGGSAYERIMWKTERNRRQKIRYVFVCPSVIIIIIIINNVLYNNNKEKKNKKNERQSKMGVYVDYGR